MPMAYLSNPYFENRVVENGPLEYSGVVHPIKKKVPPEMMRVFINEVVLLHFQVDLLEAAHTHS